MKLYALSIIISSIINYLSDKKAENYVFSNIKNVSYSHIGKYKVLKKNTLKESTIFLSNSFCFSYISISKFGSFSYLFVSFTNISKTLFLDDA